MNNAMIKAQALQQQNPNPKHQQESNQNASKAKGNEIEQTKPFSIDVLQIICSFLDKADTIVALAHTCKSNYASILNANFSFWLGLPIRLPAPYASASPRLFPHFSLERKQLSSATLKQLLKKAADMWKQNMFTSFVKISNATLFAGEEDVSSNNSSQNCLQPFKRNPPKSMENYDYKHVEFDNCKLSLLSLLQTMYEKSFHTVVFKNCTFTDFQFSKRIIREKFVLNGNQKPTQIENLIINDIYTATSYEKFEVINALFKFIHAKNVSISFSVPTRIITNVIKTIATASSISFTNCDFIENFPPTINNNYFYLSKDISPVSKLEFISCRGSLSTIYKYCHGLQSFGIHPIRQVDFIDMQKLNTIFVTLPFIANDSSALNISLLSQFLDFEGTLVIQGASLVKTSCNPLKRSREEALGNNDQTTPLVVSKRLLVEFQPLVQKVAQYKSLFGKGASPPPVIQQADLEQVLNISKCEENCDTAIQLSTFNGQNDCYSLNCDFAFQKSFFVKQKKVVSKPNEEVLTGAITRLRLKQLLMNK